MDGVQLRRRECQYKVALLRYHHYGGLTAMLHGLSEELYEVISGPSDRKKDDNGPIVRRTPLVKVLLGPRYINSLYTLPLTLLG